jgi:hypothetical protein
MAKCLACKYHLPEIEKEFDMKRMTLASSPDIFRIYRQLWAMKIPSTLSI